MIVRHVPEPDLWLLTLDAGGAVLIAAVVQLLGTLIAALVAWRVTVTYKKQRALTRQQSRDRAHAEAVRAIHDYLEAPYRVRRRDGSAPARLALTEAISDIQSRLRYYEALLHLSSTSDVAQKYADACRAARGEAGVAMTAAWTAKPTKRDGDVPLVDRYETPDTARHLTELVALMQRASERGA
jgi:hypothetical protein